ncbi:uncharacterized protein LOC110021960 [Phalaenopsis equestris]|uniref:uncharacterized protein LOC110021960 n=1 Tax=Phalaenopsis equestris TaxID=78828 RepID=UPI0009E45D5E|nr:uncharacterized protein LOC110021960 [Phalaenopsis equestris]
MLPLDSSVVDRGGGGGEEGVKERVAIRIMTRCCCTAVVSLGVSFLLSFVFGFVAIVVGSLSASNPVAVPAVCRIVSSSVDIKSSRVCELGFLNYKVTNTFHPKEKTTFRCRDDYYWASIFEVEFTDYFSGQILHSIVEAPKEALPQDCRPNFDTAWMTKLKFEVNETYKCTYTLGSQKADIYPDSFFNCKARDPSTEEMIRRFFVLFTRSLSEKSTAGPQLGFTVAGIVLGMLASLCCIILIKILQAALSSLANQWNSEKHLIQILRRACLLVTYLCAFAWLILQWQKLIGFKHLYINSDL